MTTVTVLERGESLTAIKVDGKEIHEGSGEHTREAMREVAYSFARHLGFELEYDEEEGDGDWSC
jgi:hypothetical protein